VRKPSVKSRSIDQNRGPGGGAPTQQHDEKRRLGNFTGAGEHSRIGGRTTGIVGQTKRRWKTDQAKNTRSRDK